MDTRWTQRHFEIHRALCISFAPFALPKDPRFAGDDLRFDAGRRQQDFTCDSDAPTSKEELVIVKDGELHSVIVRLSVRLI